MEKSGESLAENIGYRKPSAYFESLVGQQVRVYREGPECQVGKLLAATPDYLAVKTLENQVVYYQTYHINSINQEPEVKKTEQKENAKENEKKTKSAQMPEVEEVSYFVEENFAGLLRKLQYKAIQIDRNGPESRCGLLLDVKSDYLAILTKKDGIVFYPFFHIKSISEYPMDSLDIEYPRNITASSFNFFSQAETFSGVLSDFIGHNVQINRGGPESRQGQIISVNPNFVALQNSLDSLYIYVNHHIRNVSEIPLESDNTSSNEENESNSDSNTKRETKYDEYVSEYFSSKNEEEENDSDSGKKDSKKQGNESGKDNSNSQKGNAQNQEESDIISLLTNLVKLDVNSFDGFAQRMVNQRIYVYTVGHEPIEGYLSNLTLNYLVVRDEDGNFVCCNTEHIKVFQIRFDTKKQPSDGFKPDGFRYEAFRFLFGSPPKNVEIKVNRPAAATPFSEAESFAQLIGTIKDSNSLTKINHKAAEVASIAAQKEDVLALQTEANLILYNPSHIKSFTIFSDPEGIQKQTPMAWEGNYQRLLQAKDFRDCLNALKYQWIQINRFGPAKTEGMVLEIFDDYFTLFNKQKIYRLPFHQLHDICLGP